MKFTGASSVVPVGEEIPAGVTGAGKAELTLPPVDNTPKPIEFILLVDGSYSNRANSVNLLNGLRNFVANLPDNSLSMEVYFIGVADSIVSSSSQNIDLSPTRKREISEKGIKDPIVKVIKSASQTKAEFTSLLNVELNKIETLLNATAPGGADTYPTFNSDMISLISSRRGKGSNMRSVYIYATDEDMHSNYSGYTSMKTQIDQIQVSNGPPSTYYFAPIQCSVSAEGGGTRVIDAEVGGCPTCYPKVDSCGDTAGISAAIAARSGCFSTPTTYSGCRTQTIGGGFGWQSVNDSRIFTDWAGREFFGNDVQNKIKNVTDQILDLNQLPGQPQMFLGLFSIRSQDVKNPDQEVATNIQNMVQKMTPNGNSYMESINSTDYRGFLQAVSDFKIRTENNRVSLAPLLQEIPNGYSLIVKKIQILDHRTQAFVEITKYQINGQELILQDLSFDYQLGTQIKIDYQY